LGAKLGYLTEPTLDTKILILPPWPLTVVYQIFMSCFLLIKGAYIQAFVLWLLIPGGLWQFHSHCTTRFTLKSVYLPSALSKEMVVASIPMDTYVAPQMHPKFKGLGKRSGESLAGIRSVCQKVRTPTGHFVQASAATCVYISGGTASMTT